MALVEPLVGHLLSQYTETVLEGLEKIRTNATADPEFGPTLANSASAVEALKNTLLKQEKKQVVVSALQTICVIVEHSDAQPGSRAHLLRELCRGDVFTFLRKSISVLSDETLALCMAALQLLTLMAVHVPRILLARFNHKLPLTLACFRAQLPYSQRRLRAARLELLLALTTSKYGAVSASVVVEHGCLTQVLDDAAELLQEGTAQGLKLGRAALHMFEQQFISSGLIPVEQKRSVLLAQRNVFRLFVKALEYPAVAGDAERLVYRMVAELMESPSDYATTRTDTTDERGMPNFILFFLLRQLRPKNSALVSRLVVFILHKAPDLIRPYLVRVSGHLPDDGNTAQRIAPATARIATLNVMTRILLAPIPYHLSAQHITLEPIAARATTFYTMSPQAVVNEICPAWLAEYVHRLINGSTNLMMLTLAMQLTQAALERAQAVLALVAQAQEKQQHQRRLQRQAGRAHAQNNSSTAPSSAHARSYALEAEEVDVDEEGHAVDWESFDAQVQAALLQAVPRREEFWHRMTQQIHPLLLAEQKNAFAAAQDNTTTTTTTTTTAATTTVEHGAVSRVEFVTQRMLTLMRQYMEVFQLRVSWLSAVPVFVPTFSAATMTTQSGARRPIITTALQMGNDVLASWQPASVSALCALLVPSLMRGVSMTKLHHITMSSSAQGGVAEWPLLMSLLLWAVRAGAALKAATEATEAEREETVNAVAWVARLVQWTVHSVTVRFGCGFEESLTWVQSLTPETIPCFLHLLNNLLQRSLSKVADRVAKELFEAEAGKGVLVIAAEAFLARTEEKQQQRAETAAATAAAPPAPPAASSGGKRKAGAPAPSAPATDLWTEDLYANLAGFRAVVAQVQTHWDARVSASRAFCAPLLAQQARAQAGSAALEGPQGQRRIALTSAALPAQPQQHEALTPAHEQLLQFGRTLRAPVAMRGEDEIELLVAITAQENAPSDDAGEGKAAKTKKAKPSQSASDSGSASMSAVFGRVGVRRWASMHAVCWEAAGYVLRALNAIQRDVASAEAATSATSAAASSSSARVAVAGLATSLLEQIAKEAPALRQSLLADHADSSGLAFVVLVLALLRALLTVKTLQSSPAEAALLDATRTETWMGPLEALLLSTYQGTTTTVDRARYAALLSLHYLTTEADETGSAPRKPEEDGPSDAEDEDVRDSTSDEESVSEEEEEHADAAAGGAKTVKPLHAVPRRLFAGALVPRAFTQHRYLISDHSPAGYVTPEVDMLSLLVDAWTEDAIRTMALQTPIRLSNTILCGARQSEWDLVRSVFPEVTCEEDLTVTAFARVSAATTADPRFLLPLLQTTLALPPERVSRTVALGLRCLPVLLRALSCTEASLRGLAATALSTLYIPSGPNRIVTTFARMKLLQLSQKAQQRQHQRRGGAHGRRRPHQGGRGGGGGAAAGKDATTKPLQGADAKSAPVSLPRLPTPIGSLLILAMRPLGEYAHPLHNHLIRFLIDARNALGTSVPFAQWLSAFPLEAVSAPLMIARHEELQKDGAAQSSSIAQTSAAEVAARIRKDMPPQLDFILRLVGSACETHGDAMAMLHSGCVQNLMLLAGLVSASPELRLSFVQALATMCAASYRVTVQLAVQARVLLWAVGFALQLCREFAGSPHRFGEPLFCAVLALVATLSAVLGAAPRHRHAALHGQAEELLHVLYHTLVDANVTSKQTLEMVEKAVQAWQVDASTAVQDRLGRRREHTSAAPGVKRPHEENEGEEAQTAAASNHGTSPAKKVRRK